MITEGYLFANGPIGETATGFRPPDILTPALSVFGQPTELFEAITRFCRLMRCKVKFTKSTLWQRLRAKGYFYFLAGHHRHFITLSRRPKGHRGPPGRFILYACVEDRWAIDYPVRPALTDGFFFAGAFLSCRPVIDHLRQEGKLLQSLDDVEKELLLWGHWSHQVPHQGKAYYLRRIGRPPGFLTHQQAQLREARLKEAFWGI